MDDVILRPIQEADLDDLGRYLTDPEAYGEFEWTGFKEPGCGAALSGPARSPSQG